MMLADLHATGAAFATILAAAMFGDLPLVLALLQRIAWLHEGEL